MNNQTAIIIYSIVLGIFLVLSFIFSSSDMAYGSVDLLRFDTVKSNKKSYIRGRKLAENYDSTISTILLLNDTVNAGIDSFSTLLGVNVCYLIFTTDLNNGLITASELADLGETWGLIFSLVVLLIKIMFGEIIAKSLGKIFNFKLANVYANMLTFFSYLLLPITFLVSGFGKVITYPVTKNVKDIEINDEDLHEMVDDIVESGQMEEDQGEILHDAIDYTKTEAYEIMTPRVDIVAIDIDDDIDDILNDPNIFRFSRVPVYENTIDNIIGFVKTKTLMFAKISKQDIKLMDILIEPLRYPRSTEINDILKEFKKLKKHFALIMDEYGGVEGILTMEDILEEIVGDIWDEKDDPNALSVEIKENQYIVDGMLNLEDFCSLFNLDYDEIDTEYVTIGGFCIELKDDKFAKVGDILTYKNLTLKILSIDETNKSIEKIMVTINNE